VVETSADASQKSSSDQDVFARCQRRLREIPHDPVAGYYGPDSMHWVVFREPALVIGGLKAIALQMAHPRVAAGISQNSNFRKDVLGRAKRTFAAMYEMVFGDEAQAGEACRRVHALHARVRGTVASSGPPPWAGCPVRALDPELLSWVLATCLATALQVFDTFVRPLTLDEKRRYYLESMRMGLQFGLEPEHRPATWDAFQAWYDGMLEGDALIVTDAGREVVHELFNSPYTRGPVDETITAGLMTPRWREAYGLRWGGAERRAYTALVRGLRLANRSVPVPMRYAVAWHQAKYRMDLAGGRRGTAWARLINRLDARMDLPFSIRPIGLHADEPV